MLSKLTELLKKYGCKIIAITPFLAFKNTENIRFIYEAGPIEFLEYIWNAKLIVTDSYHGTLFSINFNKPFYSITKGSASHMRKNQILEELVLDDCICTIPDNILIEKTQNYTEVNKALNRLRENSVNYLRLAIE